MTLSQAIKLGAAMRPQAFGGVYITHTVIERIGWFRKRVKQERRSCAWGAALEAAGTLDIPTHWPIYLRVDCPQCNEFKSPPSLLRLMAHLNDDHRWTREQVAVFVERVESGAITPHAETEVEWPSEIEVGAGTFSK